LDSARNNTTQPNLALGLFIAKTPPGNSGGVFVLLGLCLHVVVGLFIGNESRMKKKKTVLSRFAKAGRVKSRAKTAAARKNGMLGGRPPKWR
jgi:hypothetical protein